MALDPPGGQRRTRHRPAVLAAACCAAVALAGCAAVPGSGPVTSVRGGNGQAQAYVQPLPPPRPQRGWSPRTVVEGFLAASAVVANNYRAAREFLAPPLNQTWQPSTVTITGSVPHATQLPGMQHEVTPAGEPGRVDEVKVSGQRLATLTPSGQYNYQPGTPTYVFKLAQTNGIWLIQSMSTPGSNNNANNLLLLTQDDFEQVYQPRNLYYFGPGGKLVPDPVFAPLQGTNFALNTDLATRLVTALLDDPSSGSWLYEATTTAFPVRPRLSVRVRFSGSTAIVELRGPARLSSFQLGLMADQLVWTLTSPSYRAFPVAHSVQLRLNGKTVSVNHQQTLQIQTLNMTPPAVKASTVYLVNSGGGVSAYTLGHKTTLRQVVSPAQVGHARIGSVAASPGQGELALTVHSTRGCTVYYGHPGSTQPLTSVQLSARGATCSAVSWDNQDNIWVAAGSHVWVLDAATKLALPIVTLPTLPGTAADTSYPVEALQVAPDGVRVAMLVKTPTGRTQLIAAAILDEGNVFVFGQNAISVGSSVADPTAVSWYDPDHLVVLGRSQLFVVPLTGGAAQPIGLVPEGTDALTAAGTVLAVGSANDVRMAGQLGTWHVVAKGSQPAFPG